MWTNDAFNRKYAKVAVLRACARPYALTENNAEEGVCWGCVVVFDTPDADWRPQYRLERLFWKADYRRKTAVDEFLRDADRALAGLYGLKAGKDGE